MQSCSLQRLASLTQDTWTGKRLEQLEIPTVTNQAGSSVRVYGMANAQSGWAGSYHTHTKALSKEYELEAVNQLSVSDTARITQIMQTPTLQAIARHNCFTSS